MTPLPGTVSALDRSRARFTEWLISRGSEVLKPTNPYEVLRFSGPTNICVIYSNGKGQIKHTHWQNGAELAWAAFLTGDPWRAADRTARTTRKDWRMVEDIAHRDGWTCVYCGTDLTCETATIEHFVPLTSGGPDNMANRMLACKPVQRRRRPFTGAGEDRDGDPRQEWETDGRYWNMTEVIAFVAEFQKGTSARLELFNLVTFEDDGRGIGRRYYDVDWSKRFGCYVFDYSGGGGDDIVEVSGIYFSRGPVKIVEKPTTLVHGGDHPPWTSPETLAIRARNQTRRLKALPRGFRSGRGGNLLKWLQDNGIQRPSVWCSQCGDCFPDDQVCGHIWWCEETCEWSTPGGRCGCGTRAVCSGDFAEDEEEFAFSPRHLRCVRTDCGGEHPNPHDADLAPQ